MYRGICGEKVKNLYTFVYGFFGAYNRIRTGDLILTKDALYHLSYISIALTSKRYYTYMTSNCQVFLI